jgi:RsiW-degrading membrane proteinase PrsW (M82 family)
VASRSFYRVVFALLALSVVAGIAAPRVLARALPQEEVAKNLQREGRWKDSEAIYWRLLREEPPTLDRIVGFLDAHVIVEAGLDRHKPREHKSGDVDLGRELEERRAPRSPIDDAAIDDFFRRPDLSPDAVLLGTFWRGTHRGAVDSALRERVRAAADADPPMPWANRLLGRDAEGSEKVEDAVRFFLREGRAVPAHAQDVNHALALLIEVDDWEGIGNALADPAVERVASAAVKARWAAQVGAWKRLLQWIVPGTYERPEVGPLVLAGIAAIAWGVFCARLGHLRERPVYRTLVYLTAFVLGVLSVIVTDALILVEQAKLNLVETGDPARDILFFIFGVGFREELSKLLLFLPLLPLLRRKGTKLDVLVAGAFVGLGFAATENLSYLASGSLQTGLGRFLTANFLHMSMTAILASALDDFAHHGDAHAPELSKTIFVVMGLHGAYDFFLSHPEFMGGYAAMIVFFFLANQFLHAVDTARGRTQPDETLLRTFLLGVTVVCGASYVWASILVGPGTAAFSLFEGLLGTFIIIYVFGRRLHSM